jgi:hypothetical protein
MPTRQLPFAIEKTAAGNIIIETMKMNLWLIFIVQAAEFGMNKHLNRIWKATKHRNIMELSNMSRY